MNVHDMAFELLYESINQDNIVSKVKEVIEFIKKEHHDDENIMFLRLMMKYYRDEIAIDLAKYISYVFVDYREVDFYDDYYEDMVYIYNRNKDHIEVASEYARILWYGLCCKVKRYYNKETLDKLCSIHERFHTKEMLIYTMHASIVLENEKLTVEEIYDELVKLFQLHQL